MPADSFKIWIRQPQEKAFHRGKEIITSYQGLVEHIVNYAERYFIALPFLCYVCGVTEDGNPKTPRQLSNEVKAITKDQPACIAVIGNVPESRINAMTLWYDFYHQPKTAKSPASTEKNLPTFKLGIKYAKAPVNYKTLQGFQDLYNAIVSANGRFNSSFDFDYFYKNTLDLTGDIAKTLEKLHQPEEYLLIIGSLEKDCFYMHWNHFMQQIFCVRSFPITVYTFNVISDIEEVSGKIVYERFTVPGITMLEEFLEHEFSTGRPTSFPAYDSRNVARELSSSAFIANNSCYVSSLGKESQQVFEEIMRAANPFMAGRASIFRDDLRDDLREKYFRTKTANCLSKFTVISAPFLPGKFKEIWRSYALPEFHLIIDTPKHFFDSRTSNQHMRLRNLASVKERILACEEIFAYCYLDITANTDREVEYKIGTIKRHIKDLGFAIILAEMPTQLFLENWVKTPLMPLIDKSLKKNSTLKRRCTAEELPVSPRKTSSVLLDKSQTEKPYGTFRTVEPSSVKNAHHTFQFVIKKAGKASVTLKHYKALKNISELSHTISEEADHYNFFLKQWKWDGFCYLDTTGRTARDVAQVVSPKKKFELPLFGSGISEVCTGVAESLQKQAQPFCSSFGEHVIGFTLAELPFDQFVQQWMAALAQCQKKYKILEDRIDQAKKKLTDILQFYTSFNKLTRTYTPFSPALFQREKERHAFTWLLHIAYLERGFCKVFDQVAPLEVVALKFIKSMDECLIYLLMARNAWFDKMKIYKIQETCKTSEDIIEGVLRDIASYLTIFTGAQRERVGAFLGYGERVGCFTELQNGFATACIKLKELLDQPDFMCRIKELVNWHEALGSICMSEENKVAMTPEAYLPATKEEVALFWKQQMQHANQGFLEKFAQLKEQLVIPDRLIANRHQFQALLESNFSTLLLSQVAEPLCLGGDHSSPLFEPVNKLSQRILRVLAVVREALSALSSEKDFANFLVSFNGVQSLIQDNQKLLAEEITEEQAEDWFDDVEDKELKRYETFESTYEEGKQLIDAIPVLDGRYDSHRSLINEQLTALIDDYNTLKSTFEVAGFEPFQAKLATILGELKAAMEDPQATLVSQIGKLMELRDFLLPSLPISQERVDSIATSEVQDTSSNDQIPMTVYKGVVMPVEAGIQSFDVSKDQSNQQATSPITIMPAASTWDSSTQDNPGDGQHNAISIRENVPQGDEPKAVRVEEGTVTLEEKAVSTQQQLEPSNNDTNRRQKRQRQEQSNQAIVPPVTFVTSFFKLKKEQLQESLEISLNEESEESSLCLNGQEAVQSSVLPNEREDVSDAPPPQEPQTDHNLAVDAVNKVLSDNSDLPLNKPEPLEADRVNDLSGLHNTPEPSLPVNPEKLTFDKERFRSSLKTTFLATSTWVNPSTWMTLVLIILGVGFCGGTGSWAICIILGSLLLGGVSILGCGTTAVKESFLDDTQTGKPLFEYIDSRIEWLKKYPIIGGTIIGIGTLAFLSTLILTLGFVLQGPGFSFMGGVFEWMNILFLGADFFPVDTIFSAVTFVFAPVVIADALLRLLSALTEAIDAGYAKSLEQSDVPDGAAALSSNTDVILSPANGDVVSKGLVSTPPSSQLQCQVVPAPESKPIISL